MFEIITVIDDVQVNNTIFVMNFPLLLLLLLHQVRVTSLFWNASRSNYVLCFAGDCCKVSHPLSTLSGPLLAACKGSYQPASISQLAPASAVIRVCNGFQYASNCCQTCNEYEVHAQQMWAQPYSAVSVQSVV